MPLASCRDCRVWSAATDDYDDAERELLDEFSRTVPAAERRTPRAARPLANLKNGYGQVKAHRIGGSRLA